VFFTFCGLQIFPGRPAYGDRIVDRVVVVVNEDIITLSDLNHSYAPILEKVKRHKYPLKKQRHILFRAHEKILNDLIDQKLADQEIKRSHLLVKEKEIDNAIDRLKRSNNFTDQEFRGELNRQGFTLERYREHIRNQILREKLIKRQVVSKIVLTQKEIQAYYEKNKDEFGGKPKYHLRNILKRLSSDDDPEIKKVQLQKIEAIMKQLLNGQPFESLARTHSDSPFAAEGGDLGLFSLDRVSPEIKAALEGKKVGEFTSIIETDQGLQIFYVQDIVQPKGKSLAEATPEIQNRIYKQILDKKFLEWTKDLRQKSSIKILN